MSGDPKFDLIVRVPVRKHGTPSLERFKEDLIRGLFTKMFMRDREIIGGNLKNVGIVRVKIQSLFIPGVIRRGSS